MDEKRTLPEGERGRIDNEVIVLRIKKLIQSYEQLSDMPGKVNELAHITALYTTDLYAALKKRRKG